MLKLGLEKAEDLDIKLLTSIGSLKKQESSRKTYTFALLTMTKLMTVGDSKLWKIPKEIGIPDHLTCLLRNLCAGQEATVRTRHGTMEWTGSKSGKVYIMAVYCILYTYPAYLTYMQSTS